MVGPRGGNRCGYGAAQGGGAAMGNGGGVYITNNKNLNSFLCFQEEIG